MDLEGVADNRYNWCKLLRFDVILRVGRCDRSPKTGFDAP